MNLFELFVKIGVDDQASEKIANIAGKLGNGLKTAAKIGTAAIGVAMTGITALTTAAVNNYAEYEQLVGGVDTLFKDASQKVQQYAADAYKTAGMSANDYMANATAFSASLISALGDDTEAAAEYANRAMVSMSDNANKMGTSLDIIVQTYQSLSRGNMAMLDNLKLGYGGTKAELERLIADAASYTKIQEEMGITVDATSTSFDNIVNAIAVVQGKLGIAGATALEAGTTIEGSVNSMKAAWSNLVTGVADENADMGQLIDDFVTTIVGDGTPLNLGVIGNIMPAVKNALNGATRLVSETFPIIVREIPKIITDNLPTLVDAAVGIVESLVEGIEDNQDEFLETAGTVIEKFGGGIVKLLPKMINVGYSMLTSILRGLANNADKIVPAAIQLIQDLVSALTNPETLSKLLTASLSIITKICDSLFVESNINKLIDAAVELLVNLVTFIGDNIGELFDAAVKILEGIVTYLSDPKNLEKLGGAAVKILKALANALLNAIGSISDLMTQLVSKIASYFNIDLSEQGKKAISSFFNGMLMNLIPGADGYSAMQDVAGKVSKEVEEKAKDYASSVMGSLVIGGVKVPFPNGSHASGLDYVPFDGYIAELHKGERVLTENEAKGYGSNVYNINIEVNGADYPNPDRLASAIAQKIQKMTDRRSAARA